MKKEEKGILVIIIILLVIMIPTTILSIYLKFSYTPAAKEDEPIINTITNTNQKYANGKLYFYSDDNDLLGEYTCKLDPCNYAKSNIDDKNYSIDYLVTEAEDINIINNRFAFIEDANVINLYDIQEEKIIDTYKSVKNYDNLLSSNLMIVESLENKWGLIKLEANVQTIIKPIYDFIGVVNNFDEDTKTLDSSFFIAKTGTQWLILDDTSATMSNYLSYEIVSFNDLLISVKTENIYYLYDYNGKRVINETGFNYVSFTDNYINIIDVDDNLYIYDYQNQTSITPNIKLNNKEYKQAFTTKLDKENNKIVLTVGDEQFSYDLK